MVARNKRANIDTTPAEDSAFLMSVLDAIPDELLVVDSNHTVRLVNQAARNRVDIEAPHVEKHRCYEINHHRPGPCGNADTPCILDRVFQTADLVTEEHVHLDEFGNEILMEVTGVPLRDAESKVSHMLIIGRDITERKEEETRRIDKTGQARKLESLGLLASGIAHDVNNLMMGVIGYADIALDMTDDGAPLNNALLEIIDTAKRASELAGEMLSYSGRGAYVERQLDLKLFFEEMLEEIESLIPKHIVLKCVFDETVPAISADTLQIRQIAMNLLSNAVDAVDEQAGIITVGTGTMTCDKCCLDNALVNLDIEEGTYVYLEVSDSGRGMDSETMAKIFDPFYSTKQGRGLGLTTVLGIVRNQKGAIDVFSEPNVGSRFKVFFPAISDEQKN